MSLVVVVEGDTDIPIVQALARDAGLEIGKILDLAGKSQIDERLVGYNNAAKGSPWLVLRDLDHDADCAPTFLAARPLKSSQWMTFRLAVREVEAWLLADARGGAAFLHVPERNFPTQPDDEQDPTVTLVNLARRSKRAAIRKAMVPPAGANAQVTATATNVLCLSFVRLWPGRAL
jgi:hypothetical protein